MKATLLILASALAAVSVAQRASTIIYNPTRTIADQGITVQGWGSGVIAQTDEVAYQGANSLRVSTRNFFQGGLIRFANPVNLATAFENKDNQLEIVFQVAAGSAGRAPSGGTGGIGASGLSGSSGVGGGPGGPGGPGRAVARRAPAASPPPARRAPAASPPPELGDESAAERRIRPGVRRAVCG